MFTKIMLNGIRDSSKIQLQKLKTRIHLINILLLNVKYIVHHICLRIDSHYGNTQMWNFNSMCKLATQKMEISILWTQKPPKN